MMFSARSKRSLMRAVVAKDVPIYVQFYITARCNLTCQQCNIIFANADVRECTLAEIERIAENLARVGVAIVLLTGGEPFVRQDLPGIIRAFESRGIHVRMQTNGLAREEEIARAVEAGGRDISISLDTLDEPKQDRINGGFPGSWRRALEAIAAFTRHLPREDSFASLGCVLQRDNVRDIPEVIRFGTSIGWYTSLVPVHVAPLSEPRGFRTFDADQRFTRDDFGAVDALLEEVRLMRDRGLLLYDSDQYLDDIGRFVRGEPVTWRERHGGVCDTPNLYFAILPNGRWAPCCDHRIDRPVYVQDDGFPEVYRRKDFRAEVRTVAAACEGCMYGSYPEMTISMRYFGATVQRMRTFIARPPRKPWPLTGGDVMAAAARLRGAAV
ncbi:MAG: radical SAM protein [Candidatus Polarisedimenticolia bacterium]